MPNKIFDIILRSKYAPEGVKGAIAGLKSFSEAAFFIRSGLLVPLQMAGQAIADFLATASPEAFNRLAESADKAQSSMARLVGTALGLDRLQQGAANATDGLSNFFQKLIEGDITTRKAQQEQKRLQAEYEKTASIVRRFASGFAGGIAAVGSDIRLFQGREAFREEVARARAKLDEAVVDSAQEREFLLEDIATREADRLEDIARQNARAIQDINEQRTEALQEAQQRLTEQLTTIDAQTAQRRIQIEEQYQERLRQIRQSSDQDIEEAIRRRDARALAKALSARQEQLDTAKRDRDRAQRDNEAQAAQQREQARKQFEEQQRAAEEAARKALEDLREQQREAQEEADIAAGRQLRDFDTNWERRRRKLQDQKDEEIGIATDKYNDLRKEHDDFLEDLAEQTRRAAAPDGTLAKAIEDMMRQVFDDILAGVNRLTPSRSSGRNR